MHTSKKKSAGTVRQTGSAPAELPRVANAVQAPRGERRTAGRSRRHGEWRGGASFGRLRRSFNLSHNAVVSIDAYRLAATKPGKKLSVIDDLLAESRFGNATRCAMTLDTFDYGLMSDHARQIDGQKPICQWAITQVHVFKFVGNIPL